MKKVLIALIGVLLTSCTTGMYVQVVDIQSKNLTAKENNYVYEDGNCRVSYNFWSNLGNPGFNIENITDNILYLDLANSFFIRNGIAYDYFLNRVYSSGRTTTQSSSKSASASALGVWALSNYYGSKTYSGTEVEASASMSNVSYGEKEIVAIPPHSQRTISEYRIAGDVIQNCSAKLFPKRHRPESIKYSETESPLKFANYITYRIGANTSEFHMNHEFYVSGTTNYYLEDVKEKAKDGCKGQIDYEYNKYQKGMSYFVNYDNKHSNNYSADAKEGFVGVSFDSKM